MASPQPDQYTKVSNELLEALIFYGLGAREMRVVLAIIRETYGWQKKTAYISYGYIAKITGLFRQHVCAACSVLCDKKIITIEDGSQRFKTNKIGLQKDYEKWDGFPVDNFQTLRAASHRFGNRFVTDLVTPKPQTSHRFGNTSSHRFGNTLLRKKPKEIRLKKPKERKASAVDSVDKSGKAKIASALKGHESKIKNGDPRPIVEAMQAIGYDYERVWATVVMARTAKNPAGFIVAHLNQPKFALSDEAHEQAKREMREWDHKPLEV